MKRFVWCLIAGALMLAGCSSDDDTSDDATVATPAALTVMAASGARVPVEGTWVTTCLTKGADGQVETSIFAEFQVTATEEIWTADDTCGGSPDTTNEDIVQLSVVTDKTVGWDGTPPGSNAASVTATVIEAVGFGFDLFFVDDNVSPLVLYFASDTSPTDGNGYPTLLGLDVNVKQP